MTQSPQKVAERLVAEEAAKALGVKWCLGSDRENPDFIVTEGENQFGLEVVEVFTGPQDEHGAHKKRAESETQKAVNVLRTEYEKRDETPLFVKLVGDICGENLDVVVPTLLDMNFSAKSVCQQERFEVNKGPAKLSVYATRGIQRADWYWVNDRVGTVDQNPVERIADAINGKAEKLARYREGAGLDDIHLLVVANRRMNSGKLALKDHPELDLRGFAVVYFFPYPDGIRIIGRAG